MALIQALIIVAAMAAVAAALLHRAEGARLRLQSWFEADQAALYLDAGTEQLRALLEALPEQEPVHRGQPWAQAREGVMIDRGVLAWQIDDLHGRFNVNALAGNDAPRNREAFFALAQTMHVPRGVAQRLADALDPDAQTRARAAAPGEAPQLPLIHPRQLAPLAEGAQEAFAALLPLLAALDPGAEMNVNTLHPEVLTAYVPRLGRAERDLISRAQAQTPFDSIEGFMDWAQTALDADTVAVLSGLPLGVRSSAFEAAVSVRLDSVGLRRSVVLNRDGAQGRSAVLFSVPEPE
jgi:general secretion pathway protein K